MGIRIIRIFILFTLVSLVLTVTSQTEISGFVKDELSLEPLSGANIFIPELKLGTSTNNQGYFRLSGIERQEYQIKVSYIGYHDTIFNITNTGFDNLQILLKKDSVEIESIIVTATRTPKSSEKIPQSISVIDQQVIEDYPATNVDNLLKMVPGINVNRSWGIFSQKCQRYHEGNAR